MKLLPKRPSGMLIHRMLPLKFWLPCCEKPKPHREVTNEGFWGQVHFGLSFSHPAQAPSIVRKSQQVILTKETS